MSTSLSYEALLYLLEGAFILLIVLLFGLMVAVNRLSKVKKVNIVHEKKPSPLESNLSTTEKNIEDIKLRNAFLEREIKRLAPYAKMPEVFADIKLRRADAEKYFLKATQDANTLINQAKTDADTLISESRRQIGEKNEVGDLVLRQARERADTILTDAALRAEQVAGDAWDAKDRQVFYQRTAQAMKNKVRGYGDEYLIPNETLIDDLTDEYSHKQAGRQLQCVNNQMNTMIRDGFAADCDYNDALRRDRSIAFVLDAFNGKVESIFAKIYSDNFGRMSAKLEDAFELVNYNGRSFGNARILSSYLDLCQEQLKFAIQVKELKRRDEEEQRRIKADMRDQRRARKEFKKVKRKAHKESKRILKEIEQIEAKIEQSTEVEKQKYQAQLVELMGKLSNAEAKSKRTESMTLKGKQGHVYVVSNVGSIGENVLKIGMTRWLEPEEKIKELGNAAVPFGFDVHAIIYSDDAPELQRYLHNVFNAKRINKVNPRADFFDLALGEVRAEIESLGIDCQWTMKADAQEYRESTQMKNIVKTENVGFAEILEIG